MSMTYYAVTDDPNELAHFGIKGMKWGVRHDKPRHPGSHRPRSAAYKKAQSKLGEMMKSGIKKAEAHWKEYNSPQSKALRAYKKSEKNFEKHMEKARKGTLKYKGISDAEVERITDRLALERTSRSLSGTEKPSYLRRLRESAGEGFVQGVGRGIAGYMEARGRGRGDTTAAIKREKRMAKYHGKEDVIRKDAERKLAEEYYKTAYEEGDTPDFKSKERRAQYLADVKRRNKESDYRAEVKKEYAKSMAKTRGALEKSEIDDIIKKAKANAQRTGLDTTASDLAAYRRNRDIYDAYAYSFDENAYKPRRRPRRGRR